MIRLLAGRDVVLIISRTSKAVDTGINYLIGVGYIIEWGLAVLAMQGLAVAAPALLKRLHLLAYSYERFVNCFKNILIAMLRLTIKYWTAI